MKRQGQIIAGLMQNAQDLEKVRDIALQSEGSADRELAKYQQGLEYKIGVLQNTLTELYLSLADSSSFKNFIDGLTTITSGAASLANIIGGLGTVFKFLFAVMVMWVVGLAQVNLGVYSATTGALMWGASLSTLKTRLIEGIAASRAFAMATGLITTAFNAIPVFLLITGLTYLGTSLYGLTQRAENARKEFAELQTATATLANEARDLKQLSDEYNELTNKISLTADEKSKLEGVNSRLADLYPELITQYSAEGDAIAFNTKALEDYIALKEEELRISKEATTAQFRAIQDGVIGDIKIPKLDGVLGINRSFDIDESKLAIERYIEALEKLKTTGKETVSVHDRYGQLGLANEESLKRRIAEEKTLLKDALAEQRKDIDTYKQGIRAILETSSLDLETNDIVNFIETMSSALYNLEDLEGVDLSFLTLDLNESDMNALVSTISNISSGYEELLNAQDLTAESVEQWEQKSKDSLMAVLLQLGYTAEETKKIIDVLFADTYATDAFEIKLKLQTKEFTEELSALSIKDLEILARVELDKDNPEQYIEDINAMLSRLGVNQGIDIKVRFLTTEEAIEKLRTEIKNIDTTVNIDEVKTREQLNEAIKTLESEGHNVSIGIKMDAEGVSDSVKDSLDATANSISNVEQALKNSADAWKTSVDDMRFYQETLDELSTDGFTDELYELARTDKRLSLEMINTKEDYVKALNKLMEESKNQYINAEIDKQLAHDKSLSHMSGQFEIYQQWLLDTYGIEVKNWEEVALLKEKINDGSIMQLSKSFTEYQKWLWETYGIDVKNWDDILALKEDANFKSQQIIADDVGDTINGIGNYYQTDLTNWQNLLGSKELSSLNSANTILGHWAKVAGAMNTAQGGNINVGEMFKLAGDNAGRNRNIAGLNLQSVKPLSLSGSGGSSGSSSAKEETLAIADLYLALQNAINKVNNELDILRTKMSLSDHDKEESLKLLERQNELYKEQQQNIHALANAYRLEISTLESSLSSQGFKFEGEGNDRQITNLENIAGKTKEVEEAFKRYNDLQKKELPNLGKEWWNLQNSISDTVLKMESLQIDLLFQPANDSIVLFTDKIELLDFQLSMLGDSEDNLGEKTSLLTQKMKKAEVQAKFLADEIHRLKVQGFDGGTQSIEEYNKQLSDLEKEYRNTLLLTKSINDEQRRVAESIANDTINIMKESYRKQEKIRMGALQRELRDLEDAHKRKMTLLDEEFNKYQDIINAKLESIDRQDNEESFDRELSTLQKERAEIVKNIDVLSMDDSYEARAKLSELNKQLTDQDEKIELLKDRRTKDLRKQNLKDSLDAKKKEVDATKKAETDKYEAEKRRIDDTIEMEKWKFDQLINDEAKYAQIREDIVNGHIDKVKDKLTSFIEEFKKVNKEAAHEIGVSWQELQNIVDRANSASSNLSGSSPNTGSGDNGNTSPSNNAGSGGKKVTNGMLLTEAGSIAGLNIGYDPATNKVIIGNSRHDPSNVMGTYLNENDRLVINDLEKVKTLFQWNGGDVSKFHVGGGVGESSQGSKFFEKLLGLKSDEMFSILQRGEFVIPKDTVQMMSGFKTPKLNLSAIKNNGSGLTISNLLTINGNVDRAVMPQLEDLVNKAANKVAEIQKKNLNMSGLYRGV